MLGSLPHAEAEPIKDQLLEHQKKWTIANLEGDQKSLIKKPIATFQTFQPLAGPC
jgi:hypothetical protein